MSSGMVDGHIGLALTIAFVGAAVVIGMVFYVTIQERKNEKKSHNRSEWNGGV